MAVLTVVDAAEAGGLALVSPNSGGDSFPNDGKTIFVIWSDHSSSQTVTVTAQDTTANAPGFGAVTKADAVSVVGATKVDVMGPFPTTAFNDSNGRCVVTYSGVTLMTVLPIRVN